MSDAYVQACAWLDDQGWIFSYWDGNIYYCDQQCQESAHLIAGKNNSSNGFFLLLGKAEGVPLLVTYYEQQQLIFSQFRQGKLTTLFMLELPEEVEVPTAGLWSPLVPDQFYLGHANNQVTIWERKHSSFKLVKSINLNKAYSVPPVRKYQEIRALCMNSSGDIFISGESGIITIYDTKTESAIFHQDYNQEAILGMNNLCLWEGGGVLFGTSCISSPGESQLYAWNIDLKDQSNIFLHHAGSWHLAAMKQGFDYANSCLLVDVHGAAYLYVTLGDGTLRKARIHKEGQQINLFWSQPLELGDQGGAVLALSIDQSKILAGLQNVRLINISEEPSNC